MINKKLGQVSDKISTYTFFNICKGDQQKEGRGFFNICNYSSFKI